MADSDPIERDSEPTPSSSSFLSRGLIGRFLAVGLFVALGTFAVIQSISAPEDGDHADHDHGEVVDLQVNADESEDAFKVTAAPKPAFSNAGFAKPKVNLSEKKTVIKPNVVVRPEQPLKPKPSSGFSLGNPSSPRVAAVATVKPAPKPIVKPIVKPAAKPFVKPAPKPIVKSTELTSFAARPAAPQNKPPERLAQAGSGFAPNIRGTGFGEPTASAKRTVSFGDSLNSSAQSAASATSKSFGDLRSSVSSKAGSLLDATKEKVNAGANAASGLTKNASNALSNSFGQMHRPAVKPAAKPAPAVNPSAVLRPVQSSTSGGSSGGSSTSRSSFADSINSNTRRSPATSSPRRSPFGDPEGSAAKPPARPSHPEPRPSRTETRPASPPNLMANRDQPQRGSSTQINAQLASSISLRGENIPGDRKLEGVQAPSLTIEKISPREIQVNQAADFEVKVRNVGRVAANDVIVVDRVPSGTEFIGASPEPSRLERSGEVQWTIGTIEPGEEKRIRFQLRPTKPGEIGSVAHVLFATQASMRTVVTKPVLDIVHSTRPRVLIGDNVVFDVIVENKGDGPATDVIVQEEVPEQLEYQEGFRQLEYEIGTLMPGQKRKIQLALRADKVGEFRNVVFVSGKGGLEAKHEIDVEVIAPEIRVTSDGPNRRFLQRQATHRFTIENRGTAEATNVDLVARLPGGLRYVSSDNRGRYDSSSHAVYWKMPSLREGVAGTVELTTVPVEVGQQDIRFEAKADLRLTADTVQKMQVEHLVDVHFEIDDVVDPIEVGTDTSYRIRILNQGTKAAGNVQLQVEFPRGLEPTSVDGDLRNQIQGQQVMFEPINSLPPGQEVLLSIRARGSAPGDHRVIASIRSDGREVEISKEETTRVYSDR